MVCKKSLILTLAMVEGICLEDKNKE